MHIEEDWQLHEVTESTDLSYHYAIGIRSGSPLKAPPKDFIPPDIDIGDMITAYHAGYHIVESSYGYWYKLGDNENFAHQFQYTKVFNAKFKRAKGINSCHSGYCKKVTIEDLKFERDNKLIEVNNNYNRVIQHLSNM